MPLRHRLWRYGSALPGSLLFCLRHLPLRQALRMPILVARTVTRSRMSGQIKIEGAVRPGMVKIGFGWAPLFDFRRSRGVLDMPGEVVFEGPAEIAHGAKLSISGRLVLGAGAFVNAESCILCEQEISIGTDSKVSWQTLIMDTDSHQVGDRPPCAPIVIGAHVLVGAGATILKGVTIPDGAIVAASSCVTRSTQMSAGDLVAGNPARVVRNEMSWAR